MTERERLIELIDKALDKHTSTIENYVHPTQEWIADYLLTNGVIVPPCKVGDKIYFIHRGRIKLLEIHNITYSAKNRDYYVYFKNDDGSSSNIYYNHFVGYKLFFTKEEAEKALEQEEKE